MRGNPASLKIRATPQGVHTDASEFQIKWEQTIASCEKAIKRTPVNHFLEVAKLYENKIRQYNTTAKNSFMTEMCKRNTNLLLGQKIEEQKRGRSQKTTKETMKKEQPDPNPN